MLLNFLVTAYSSRKIIVLNIILEEFRNLLRSVVNKSSFILCRYVLFEVMYINFKQILGDKMTQKWVFVVFVVFLFGCLVLFCLFVFTWCSVGKKKMPVCKLYLNYIVVVSEGEKGVWSSVWNGKYLLLQKFCWGGQRNHKQKNLSPCWFY